MTSTGRKVVGKAADGQVKRGSPKPKLASAKSVEKTGTKAPDRVNKPIRKDEPKPPGKPAKAEAPKPRRSGGAKKTATKAAKRMVTKEAGSEAKSEVAEKVKPKAPVRNAKGKNPSKASRGKLSEAQKGTASKKAPEPTKPAGKPAPKAAPKPKSKADEAADEAAKKAITKKAMDAKARLKANLAKKGKLKKS
jgi:DnaK suppressor protein